MAHKKITAFASSVSAGAGTLYPIVSAGANKIITQHTQFKSLGVVQYVEATALATATVAFLPQSTIADIYVKVLVGSSAAAGGSPVNIGIGTDATYFGTITTSGNGFYRPTNVSAKNLQVVSGAIVAASPLASANSIVIVGIGYFRT